MVTYSIYLETEFIDISKSERDKINKTWLHSEIVLSRLSDFQIDISDIIHVSK